MSLPTAVKGSSPSTTPHEDEAELLAVARRAAAGDDAATRTFLQAVWPTVTRVITGVLGARHPDLDDAVQQSLIGLVRGLGLFRGDCHPAGYAARIALHVALRARKKAGVERVRRQKMAEESVGPTFAPSPVEEAESETRRQLLRDLLENLPEEQADALGLRTVLGWSLEEIAGATGAPVNTVRSRVRLAKEALRRRIEGTPELSNELEIRP